MPSNSSMGSCYVNEEFKPNDLNDPGNDHEDNDSVYEDEDPDAIDETVSRV